MASTYISGRNGAVTFANGYVTNAYKWSATTEATLYETTAWDGTTSSSSSSGSVLWLNGMHTRSVGLKRFEGTYNCRQATSTTTNISDLTYDTWVYKYDITITADVLPGTKFTDEWERNETVGLFDVEGTAEVYIDDTDALPLAGATLTIVVAIGDNKQYLITGILDKNAVEVARDGSGRKVQVSFKNSGTSIGIVSGAPIPGASGSATFQADTGKTYTGTIAVKSIKISMDANRTSGDWEIGFVGSGTITAA